MLAALPFPVLVLAALGATGSPDLTHGPFVGHVSTTSASIWVRAAAPGDLVLRVAEAGTGEWQETPATAEAGHDFTLVLTASGLAPQTLYDYAIVGPTAEVGGTFRTPPPVGAPATIPLVFGACADEGPGTAAVWDRIGASGPAAVVLLGDTPYIDSTGLGIQRQRYRDFAAVPEMATVLRTVPWYGTWDDHDFGLNDADGNMPGKENARRAFLEYHANPSCGEDDQGIYTSFRHGPVEVFLLDTRWFAATGPSPADGASPTLLGPAQWRWLQRGLVASDAPFKVIACGVVWNKAVRPNKVDHWGTYHQERQALFRFIGTAGIDGVVLVGGDVHRSRVVRHPVADLAGYDLTELITSPMHGNVLESANVPHVGLVWDAGEPFSFLVLVADTTVNPPTISARFRNAAGDLLHTETLALPQLTAPSTSPDAPRPSVPATSP